MNFHTSKGWYPRKFFIKNSTVRPFTVRLNLTLPFWGGEIGENGELEICSILDLGDIRAALTLAFKKAITIALLNDHQVTNDAA
jgi:hypothetical protein